MTGLPVSPSISGGTRVPRTGPPRGDPGFAGAMNSDDLTLFATVARAGSISRAAIESGTDPSTISRRIALLEAEVGVRLFHRSGRGVVPTDRGRELLGFAVTVARTLGDALRAMRDGTDRGPARLRIAAQPTIARVLFGSLGHALGKRYPSTKVRFIEGLASQLLGTLDDGGIDIAILYRPEHAGALGYEPLLTEGMRLITPPDYPLRAGTFEVGDLGTVPLILPSTHHGIRLLVESLATRCGFSPRIVLECDGSISITKRLVMENCGCTVLPLAAVSDDVAAGRLRSYPLANPEVRRSVALVLGKTPVELASLRETSRIIKERVTHLVRTGAWPDTLLDAALADVGLAGAAGHPRSEGGVRSP
jgi:LysR family nitrogen assimilation transcriptional regulator